MYDISDRNTFNIASNIVKGIRSSTHPKSSMVPISIIANKQDLENGRKVSFNEGHQLALNNSAKFFEVSNQKIGFPSVSDKFLPFSDFDC